MRWHLDLFSGIGGASLAADNVWPGEIKHTFCEIDEYCQRILKKHWPEAEIYGDIRTLGVVTNADKLGHLHGQSEKQSAVGNEQAQRESTPSLEPPFLLTGGFPCQPFSTAGRRKGTEDDRYLWPEMLRVIREFRPRWVVGENVAGFITWNGGMVLRQVLSDLEGEGYEVQAFVIPAVAIGAPHRRDRIWFVANRTREGLERGRGSRARLAREDNNASNTSYTGLQGSEQQRTSSEGTRPSRPASKRSWDENWAEVATELCGVDDGLPAELDGLKLSKSQHRAARLKGLGNAWVPQVAEQIFKAIKQIDP